MIVFKVVLGGWNCLGLGLAIAIKVASPRARASVHDFIICLCLYAPVDNHRSVTQALSPMSRNGDIRSAFRPSPHKRRRVERGESPIYDNVTLSMVVTSSLMVNC